MAYILRTAALAKNFVFLSLLAIVLTLSDSALAIDAPPQIFAFEKLDVNPACLSVHITGKAYPEGSSKHPYALQTLWLENGCEKEIVVTDVRHIYQRTREAGFSGNRSFTLAYAVRTPHDLVEQKGEYNVRLDNEGVPCKLSGLEASDAPLSCAAFILAPRDSMGFVYDVPMFFEWDGKDGVRIRGEADQSIPDRRSVESPDVGKKPFWEKEPETPSTPDAARGE